MNSDQSLPTPEEAKAWLKASNHDRHWLADRIGYAKRTLDNYFSAGEFPRHVAILVGDLMRSEPANPTLPITLDDLARFEQAARLLGYDSVNEFIVETLRDKARQLRAQQSKR